MASKYDEKNERGSGGVHPPVQPGKWARWSIRSGQEVESQRGDGEILARKSWSGNPRRGGKKKRGAGKARAAKAVESSEAPQKPDASADASLAVNRDASRAANPVASPVAKQRLPWRRPVISTPSLHAWLRSVRRWLPSNPSMPPSRRNSDPRTCEIIRKPQRGDRLRLFRFLR